MTKMAQVFVAVAFCFVVLMVNLSLAVSADVPRMSKEELKALLEKDSVIVLDVRSGTDWKSSEFMIQKAVREDSDKVESWATKYPKEKTLVLYCA